jgi:hypothetical protein
MLSRCSRVDSKLRLGGGFLIVQVALQLIARHRVGKRNHHSKSAMAPEKRLRVRSNKRADIACTKTTRLWLVQRNACKFASVSKNHTPLEKR